MSFFIFFGFFVFFIILFLIISVLSTVFGVLGSIFSFGKRKNYNTQSSAPHAAESASQSKSERIYFDKTEAEDAIYEEVK